MSLKLELPHFRGKRNLFYFLGSKKTNFGGGETPQKWFIILNYFSQRTSSSRKEYFHKVLRKSIYIATCTAQIHLYKKGQKPSKRVQGDRIGAHIIVPGLDRTIIAI